MHDSNIDSVQWIEHEDWAYRRTIMAGDSVLRHIHLDLVFKGLDTFAEVYLNDSLLGRADNMFRTWEWSVRGLLRPGPNELKVIFRSPVKEGTKLRAAYGIQLPHDSDPSGVSPYIRKAAYQFGWDFCPRLVTSGIWKEVELRGWHKARFDRVVIHEDPEPVMYADFVVEECHRAVLKVFLNGRPISTRRINTCDGGTHGHASGRIKVKKPIKRWRPVGYGEQNVYDVRMELFIHGTLESVFTKRHGFRDVELDRTADSVGRAFTIKVDGRPVFVKGCNLIPPHLVPSSITDSAWVAQVRHIQAAGMNMVRVWSDGVYPPDAFFDACDTAGIMVWQDLMFANMVPGTVEFRRNAEVEVMEQLERISSHPCLALVCGNNELDVAWMNWGWQERYALHGMDSTKVERDNQEFFHKHLANGLDRAWYIPTSPSSNWGDPEGLTNGDLHYWGVWHGDSTFASFKNNVGRFVSEYGFQSYPDSALLAKYIRPESLYLGSPAVTRLQRSYKTDKPIQDAIERELGEEVPTTLGGFIGAGQRAQAKAYGMVIEAHMAARPHCMGTLLWQLNDCWPGPSWSIIDYEGNPKPAYEVVRRFYRKEEGPR